MIDRRWTLLVFSTLLLSVRIHELPEEPARLVSEGPTGRLRFTVREKGGEPVPSRLTFTSTGGEVLFDRTDAAPTELAVRKNVVYTRSGAGLLELAPGTYTVYASGGLEWSLAEAELVVHEGGETEWTAELVHEVETTGWISGDFHLHTLTYSGHGDSNLEERIISLMGEGVEFAVATDHNHNTDYAPTIAKLGVDEDLASVVGNEVSVPVGHFNVFPLDADRPVFASDHTNARELFALVRTESNRHGVVPIIQLNHPRWEGIDYFAQVGLDPVTGRAETDDYSPDFDSLEVLNENVGWGYHEPVIDGVPTGGNLHSVLEDWYTLLNRGHRAAAVGNSDSHTVHYAFAGYPRNFMQLGVDTPAAVTPAAVAGAIRDKSLFTTLGPFVEIEVNGQPTGSTVEALGHHVELALRIQAASWVDCDRAKIVVNGDVREVVEVPDTREVVRLETKREICLSWPCPQHAKSLPDEVSTRSASLGEVNARGDGWIVVLVEGDDPLLPIVPSSSRPARPVAITNPVWIETSGDEEWTPPWSLETVLFDHEKAPGGAPPSKQAGWLNTIRDLRTFYPETRNSFTEDLRRGLASEHRKVRLAALRLMESFPDPRLDEKLQELLEAHLDPELLAADPYFAAAVARAYLGRTNDEGGLAALFERPGARALLEERNTAGELRRYLPGGIDAWSVLGPFQAPAAGTVRTLAIGPETETAPDATFDHEGTRFTWTALETKSGGYLDLNALGDGTPSENAMAYAQTFLYTEVAASVLCAWGTDDGCRVYLEHDLVYENIARKGANPFEHLAELELAAGWNRLLFKVENGTGGFGLYARVLSDDVRWARRPE